MKFLPVYFLGTEQGGEWGVDPKGQVQDIKHACKYICNSNEHMKSLLLKV